MRITHGPLDGRQSRTPKTERRDWLGSLVHRAGTQISLGWDRNEHLTYIKRSETCVFWKTQVTYSEWNNITLQVCIE
jgi:hypothetical protein